jgi:hypothetical protein
MRVIFLVDAPLSERDYQRFGFNQLKSRNIEVECWDFTNLRDRKLPKEAIETLSKKINSRKFKSFNELEDFVDQIQRSVLIDLRSGYYSKYTKRWFKKQGAILVTLIQGVLPISVWQPSLLDRIGNIKQKLLNQLNSSIFKKIVKNIKNKFSSIDYDILVCNGEFNDDRADLCIHSHSFDYDLYLSVGGIPVDGKYAVFIEEGMVEHPDYHKLNIRPYCTPEKYYKAMNRLFKQVEKDLGVPVIIAANPREKNITKFKEYFNGRKVIQGDTPKLVRDSMMVIAHNSTSISFPILWKKPLLIVTTNEIERHLHYNIKALCQMLQTDCVNADFLNGKYDWMGIASKGIGNYDIYKRKLIKKENTPEKNSWDIFVDELIHYEQNKISS